MTDYAGIAAREQYLTALRVDDDELSTAIAKVSETFAEANRISAVELIALVAIRRRSLLAAIEKEALG